MLTHRPLQLLLTAVFASTVLASCGRIGFEKLPSHNDDDSDKGATTQEVDTNPESTLELLSTDPTSTDPTSTDPISTDPISTDPISTDPTSDTSTQTATDPATDSDSTTGTDPTDDTDSDTQTAYQPDTGIVTGDDTDTWDELDTGSLAACQVGGTPMFDICWYVSGSGENCTATCETRGSFNSATPSYLGSNSQQSHKQIYCGLILAQWFGPTDVAVLPAHAIGGGLGCFYNILLEASWISDTPLSEDASAPGTNRVCGCNL